MNDVFFWWCAWTAVVVSVAKYYNRRWWIYLILSMVLSPLFSGIVLCINCLSNKTKNN
jgi:hypothetical protein